MSYNYINNNDENFYVNNYDGIYINNGTLNEYKNNQHNYNMNNYGNRVATRQIKYDTPQIDVYQPIGYNYNNQHIKDISSIPSNSEIELYKKNKFVSTPNKFQDYNGHFSTPIRSGSPTRKTISNIFAATSHIREPGTFDGNNPYINWMKSNTNNHFAPNSDKFTSNSDKFTPNLDKFTPNLDISSSNPYNYAFILKVILFIILILLMVVLCIYSAKTSNNKKLKNYNLLNNSDL